MGMVIMEGEHTPPFSNGSLRGGRAWNWSWFTRDSEFLAAIVAVLYFFRGSLFFFSGTSVVQVCLCAISLKNEEREQSRGAFIPVHSCTCKYIVIVFQYI